MVAGHGVARLKVDHVTRDFVTLSLAFQHHTAALGWRGGGLEEGAGKYHTQQH